MPRGKPTEEQQSSVTQESGAEQSTEDAPTILSSDADKSTYKENPDPNPNDVSPPPGPSTIQEPGTP